MSDRAKNIRWVKIRDVEDFCECVHGERDSLKQSSVQGTLFGGKVP